MSRMPELTESGSFRAPVGPAPLGDWADPRGPEEAPRLGLMPPALASSNSKSSYQLMSGELPTAAARELESETKN